MRLSRALALVAGVTVLAAGSGASETWAQPSPAGFVRTVTNPWFPLLPGTTYVYRGVEGGRASRGVVRVTRQTRVIEGVRCTAVSDLVYAGGRLVERTTDWYAQDRAGNVWYFGEDTEELDATGRVVTREGSWLAGRDDARPGVFMPARPRVGRAYQQEHLRGHAEDRFRIVSRSARVRVPAVSSRRALLTREWSPLEPGVVGYKHYVRGIGLVSDRTVGGSYSLLVRFGR